jgi:hypothetical protein
LCWSFRAVGRWKPRWRRRFGRVRRLRVAEPLGRHFIMGASAAPDHEPKDDGDDRQRHDRAHDDEHRRAGPVVGRRHRQIRRKRLTEGDEAEHPLGEMAGLVADELVPAHRWRWERASLRRGCAHIQGELRVVLIEEGGELGRSVGGRDHPPLPGGECERVVELVAVSHVNRDIRGRVAVGYVRD